MLNKVVTESDSNKLTGLMTEAERKHFYTGPRIACMVL
jgi:hypothetical protein